MARTNAIGVRLSPDEREALDRAARSDDRSISALARKIIADWLRSNGFLGVPDAPALAEKIIQSTKRIQDVG
jgi:hypothetical protein